MSKSWGSEVIPKDQWIDPAKEYTSRGCRVVGLEIVLHNSNGKEVTYPVKGTIIIREKPLKTEYAIWALDGRNNVAFGPNGNDLKEAL
ncbi:MAG: hypothetical protein KAJ73_00755 [Zetaproteobacteria bacterium]|nr:hypothetical protein [Zetaproteobacteria bacterium]